MSEQKQDVKTDAANIKQIMNNCMPIYLNTLDKIDKFLEKKCNLPKLSQEKIENSISITIEEIETEVQNSLKENIRARQPYR